MVPVVKEIDVKGLEGIGAAYKAQIKKAREGKLAPADMGCGSITISNLGMYDVDQFIAIVNPPESCILAVGSIRVEPVWDGQRLPAGPQDDSHRLLRPPHHRRCLRRAVPPGAEGPDGVSYADAVLMEVDTRYAAI